MQIQGKTALISGGASGLGAATATKLIKHGANVVIVDLNEDMGIAHAHALGERALFIQTDITDSDQVSRAIQIAQTNFGRVDILVNCAGIVAAAKIAGKKGPHDLDLFKKIINVNLIGVFNLTREAVYQMLSNDANDEGGKGVVINTASVAAFEGQIGQIAYAASKAAIVGMTLPMARDLADDGIRVCTIAPGIFETPMMASLPETARVSLGKTVPFPSRLGNPDEFAQLVQSIIENPMLNGETIRLDGAIRMTPK